MSKNNLTEFDEKAAKDLLKYIGDNCERRAVKIAVNFQHRKFKENTGFALIKSKDSKSSHLLDRIIRGVKEMVRAELDGETWEITKHDPEFDEEIEITGG